MPLKCKQGAVQSAGARRHHEPGMPCSIIACLNAPVYVMMMSGDTWLTCSHTGRIRTAALSILVATDRHAVAVNSAGQLVLHGCKTQAGVRRTKQNPQQAAATAMAQPWQHLCSPGARGSP